MAKDSRQQQPVASGDDTRPNELRALAARIFAQTAASREKTPEAKAGEAISLARAFFRVWDEQQSQSAVGLSTPTPQG